MGSKVILEKLDSIQSELNYIKEHMVDVDTILSSEDKIAVKEARKEFKQGKTVSLAEVKKRFNV